MVRGERSERREGRNNKKRPMMRQKYSIKFQLPKDATIDYKNLSLLQRYLTDRGKIVSRRVSEVTAKEQRQLTSAIKKARFLGLLPTGGVKK